MVLVESGLYIFRDMEQGFTKYYPNLSLKNRNGTFTIQNVDYSASIITLSDTCGQDTFIKCSYEEFSVYFRLILDYREVRVPKASEKWWLLYHMEDIFVTADNKDGWDNPSIYIRKNASPDPIFVKMIHNK